MPALIEYHEKEAEKLERDIPQLRGVVNSVWRKEDELKELKTELASVSRKIELSLKPVDKSEEKEKEKEKEKEEEKETASANCKQTGRETLIQSKVIKV